MKISIILMACSVAYGLIPSELRERDVIAYTLWSEARGEPFEGIVAVASVIVNRAEKRRLTPSGTCLQQNQFSCWNGFKTNSDFQRFCSGEYANPKLNLIRDYCYQLSDDIMKCRFVPSGNWDHYYNPDLCSPNWRGNLSNIRKIGRHLFGKYKNNR